MQLAHSLRRLTLVSLCGLSVGVGVMTPRSGWARGLSLTPYRLRAPLAPSLRLDPDYRSGRRDRTVGMIITAAGGAAGLGLLALAVRFTTSAPVGQERPLAGRVGLGLVAGAVLMSSLTVGLSMWGAGQRRMDHAARQYAARRGLEALVVALEGGGGALAARWRF